MRGGLIVVKVGNRQFRSWGIGQVTDDYIVDQLRRLEARFPEDYELDQFVNVGEDLVDEGRGMHNYEMLKLEAETRGLTWRLA